MPVDETHDSLCVIVGATGALGRDVVQRLADRYTVLAVARSADDLADLAQQVPTIRTCAADASDDAFIDAVAAQTDRPVRMALFAAGLGVAGSIDVISPGEIARAGGSQGGRHGAPAPRGP